MEKTKYAKMGLGFALALSGALMGCVHTPPERAVFSEVPPDYTAPRVVVPGDYVYYPGYEVYYSRYQGQYTYQEGSVWVSRSTPPRVPVEVLVASPSVRLDFQGAPAVHHAQVVQQYPKNWVPSVTDPNYQPADRNYIRANDEGER